MAPSAEQLILPAILLGIGAHLGYFIRGEHHTSSAQLVLSALLGGPALCLYLVAVRHLPLDQSIKTTAVTTTAFATSLTISILVYRYFLHPLRRYPGPAAARLSKFWQVQKTVSQYNTFELLDKLHTEYGDFVRSGPNELSIIDPDVVDAVYGPQSSCRKGNWYDISLPITSLHQLRDPVLHSKRRRGGWDKAFNTKSLRAYDDRVTGFADLLLQKLDSFRGRPVDASKWLNFYSYDVMGSLGFGRSFDTLKTGGSHKFIDILEAGFAPMKMLTSVSYIVSFVMKLPLDNPVKALNQYSDDCVQERKRNKSAAPDILGHLIEYENFFGDPRLDHDLLLGDSRLVIVAGSDTTAAALTYTLMYIAKDPSIAEKIRAELKERDIHNDEMFSVLALQNLPYLNGVINEGLRLHPPVPGGVFRKTPKQGLQVGSHFIPGDVNILVPTYSLQRSPKNFAKPEAFIPERWTTQPELVLHKNTWMPFSAGAYSCVGKHLAMGELRTVISKILLEFDVRLAPNETCKEIFEKQRDAFTVRPGKLELCFVKRGELN